MSGGVDSSVAAALLHEQGYDIIGVTMKLWDFEQVGGNVNHESGCCSLESFNDARMVCASLGVPHYVLNFSREFHEGVVQDFIDEYLAGRTPNPCVQCNTKIKWRTLVDKAEELGADYISTGHYAQTHFNPESGRFELIRAVDDHKDQSYALWGITQKSLSKTLFPLGGFTKPQVRDLARKFGLRTAEKKESQEICFIPDNNYHRLLKSIEPGLAGKVDGGAMVDSQGNVLGKHEGYPFYTIGQRKGLGGGFEKPMYVTEIDQPNNRVIVGPKEELYHRSFRVQDVNLIRYTSIDEPLKVDIKIRYNDDGHPGIIRPATGGSELEAVFDQPQKSITPGQSAVFFEGDQVVGGGIIETKI